MATWGPVRWLVRTGPRCATEAVKGPQVGSADASARRTLDGRPDACLILDSGAGAQTAQRASTRPVQGAVIVQVVPTRRGGRRAGKPLGGHFA
jgi:hypothetical protein